MPSRSAPAPVARRPRRPVAVLVAALLSAAAGWSPAPVLAAGPYVDASAYVSGEAQIEAWYGMTRQLKRDFDLICGDTFCEGEYTNIEALSYRCSVHRVSGRIGMCAWTFAASREDVDPATGKLAVRPQSWTCRTRLVPGTTLEALLAAVDGRSPLYAPLPGGAAPIYEGLIGCL